MCDVAATYRYLLELGMLVCLTELVLLGLKGKWYVSKILVTF